jgi:hypothetical protein
MIQSMRIIHPSTAALILLASSTLIFTPKAKANPYRCFDRKTGEQVAVSDIDITTPSMSCLPNEGTMTPPSKGNGSDPETVPPSAGATVGPYDDEDDSGFNQSPGDTTVDPLAARRAINLARGTAVSLNGGLSQYRPASCMFASALNNTCISQADNQGIEFRIPGGPPGWEQNDEEPSVITVVIIAPDGRSVLESTNN